MHKQEGSYRHIFKATGLFGGVQVLQILANLVRGKFVAILLGPAGMGITNLFLSSTTMISNITGLGLNFSAVRDISIAAETNDILKISRTIKVFRRWIWFSGLTGAIITLSFAPVLSKTSFGDNGYTWGFVLISCILLLNALAKGNKAILQGMRRLKDLARSTVIGSLVGLLSSVPLYYLYGIKGIVPSLILAALTQYIATSYFTNKIKYEPVKVTWKETISEGQEMVKLGTLMMISVFLGSLVTYLVNAFIRFNGGISDVGLYQAGLSITSQYIGLIFVAMSSDYFPRLSAISSDNKKVREMVNQQAEIVLLIAAPLLIAMLILAPVVVRVLLSQEFFPIIEFIRWLSIGILFKAASYSVGYIAFAKGDKKFFFIIDGVLGNSITLILNIFSYNLWGLKGLGISFLISYLIYFILIQLLTKKAYTFTYTHVFYRIFIFFLILCIITFVVTLIANSVLTFIFGGIIFIFSVLFSFRELDRRIGLKTFLYNFLKK